VQPGVLVLHCEGIPKDERCCGSMVSRRRRTGIASGSDESGLPVLPRQRRSSGLTTQSAIWTRRAARTGLRSKRQTAPGPSPTNRGNAAIPLEYSHRLQVVSQCGGSWRRSPCRHANEESCQDHDTVDQLAAAPRAVATQPEAKGAPVTKRHPGNRGAVPQPSPGRGPTRTAIENPGAERGSIFSVALSGPRHRGLGITKPSRHCEVEPPAQWFPVSRFKRRNSLPEAGHDAYCDDEPKHLGYLRSRTMMR